MPSGGHSKGGRKKKPTKVHELQGTKQPCRTNELEPEYDSISGADCPDWLAEDVVCKEMWNWTINLLSGSGVLTKADLPTIELFCVLYSDLKQIAIDMKKQGRVYYVEKMDSNGNIITEPKTSPLATQFNTLLTQYRQFSTMLGLDPSSRPGINGKGKKEGDKFQF